ncbi:hypothetical protein CKO28_00100 [Rhodovibrio sodomensis]|uniref:Uncharacterized protein n=1 Tax=Rhodovibrio sodomensis TaxID=1088 RepID=A0ABS1DAJ6_9PROT|nr:hypothetical protein [Rhodovibrio sodomensis]MBK1666440.1 hypothetical protein [Rhodovibrio sodomensis]
MHAIIDYRLTPRADGPSIPEMEAQAKRLGRSLDSLSAAALMHVTERILQEAAALETDENGVVLDTEDADYTTGDAIADTVGQLDPDTTPVMRRLDFVTDEDAPSMTDVDDIAAALGISRDAYLSACTHSYFDLQLYAQQEADSLMTAAVDQLPDDLDERVEDLAALAPDTNELHETPAAPADRAAAHAA